MRYPSGGELLEITDLKRVRLAAEDTLVVKLSGRVTNEVALEVKAHVQNATGHHRVLVISDGVALEVMGPYPKVVD